MSKRYWSIVVIAAIVVVATFFIARKKSAPVNQPTTVTSPTTFQALPTTEPTEEPLLSSTPKPENKTESQSENITTVPGVTNGNLVCNYLIPAAPNHFGTVSIDTTWNNLVPGTNGKYKADLCVSADGGATQTLMTSKNIIRGQSTETADWISLSSDYTFTLFDEHGGDLPQCNGVTLSSCQIHTQHIPTPVPTRSH